MRSRFLALTLALGLIMPLCNSPLFGSSPPPDGSSPDASAESLVPHLSERINGVRHYRNRPQQGQFFSDVTVEITDADRAATQQACESFDSVASNPAGPRFLQIDDSIELPVVRTRILPDYHAEARMNQVEGYVLFEILIKDDGKVAGVCPKSLIGGDLMRSAIESLWLWELKPAEQAGNAVPVVLRLELHYALRSSGKRE